MRKKLGLISVDYVVGFVVMLVIIGVAISFVTWVSSPGGPFQAAIREIALRGAQDIEGETSWFIVRTPIIIESAGTSLPVEIGFVPPKAADINSIVVTDVRGTPIVSEFDSETSQVAWDAFLRRGTNIFYVTYLEGTNLKPYNWTGLTDLSVAPVAGGFRASNARVNVSLGPIGVYDLLHENRRPIFVTAAAVPRIDFGPNAGTLNPTFKVGPARAVFSYANGITAKVFANDSKIWVQAPKTAPIPSVIIQVPTTMTRYYTSTAGAEMIITSTVPQFLVQDEIDHVLDIYDPTNDIGLAIIGNGKAANVSLFDNVADFRAISINNATDFFILPHRGNFQAALSEAHLSSAPPKITVGAATRTQGVSRQRFQLAAQQSLLDYEAFKRAHALLGFDYNVTVEEVRR